MQQKESFLKTKKGKITVGAVVGSVFGLVLLFWCFGIWPFNSAIARKADVTKLKDDLVINASEIKDAAADNNKILDPLEDKLKKFEDKAKAFNKKQKEEAKKITMTKIDNVKTKISDLKNKNKQDFTEEKQKNFKDAVDQLFTELNSKITE